MLFRSSARARARVRTRAKGRGKGRSSGAAAVAGSGSETGGDAHTDIFDNGNDTEHSIGTGDENAVDEHTLFAFNDSGNEYEYDFPGARDDDRTDQDSDNGRAHDDDDDDINRRRWFRRRNGAHGDWDRSVCSDGGRAADPTRDAGDDTGTDGDGDDDNDGARSPALTPAQTPTQTPTRGTRTRARTAGVKSSSKPGKSPSMCADKGPAAATVFATSPVSSIRRPVDSSSFSPIASVQHQQQQQRQGTPHSPPLTGRTRTRSRGNAAATAIAGAAVNASSAASSRGSGRSGKARSYSHSRTRFSGRTLTPLRRGAPSRSTAAARGGGSESDSDAEGDDGTVCGGVPLGTAVYTHGTALCAAFPLPVATSQSRGASGSYGATPMEPSGADSSVDCIINAAESASGVGAETKGWTAVATAVPVPAVPSATAAQSSSFLLALPSAAATGGAATPQTGFYFKSSSGAVISLSSTVTATATSLQPHAKSHAMSQSQSNMTATKALSTAALSAAASDAVITALSVRARTRALVARACAPAPAPAAAPASAAGLALEGPGAAALLRRRLWDGLALANAAATPAGGPGGAGAGAGAGGAGGGGGGAACGAAFVYVSKALASPPASASSAVATCNTMSEAAADASFNAAMAAVLSPVVGTPSASAAGSAGAALLSQPSPSPAPSSHAPSVAPGAGSNAAHARSGPGPVPSGSASSAGGGGGGGGGGAQAPGTNQELALEWLLAVSDAAEAAGRERLDFAAERTPVDSDDDDEDEDYNDSDDDDGHYDDNTDANAPYSNTALVPSGAGRVAFRPSQQSLPHPSLAPVPSLPAASLSSLSRQMRRPPASSAMSSSSSSSSASAFAPAQSSTPSLAATIAAAATAAAAASVAAVSLPGPSRPRHSPNRRRSGRAAARAFRALLSAHARLLFSTSARPSTRASATAAAAAAAAVAMTVVVSGDAGAGDREETLVVAFPHPLPRAVTRFLRHCQPQQQQQQYQQQAAQYNHQSAWYNSQLARPPYQQFQPQSKPKAHAQWSVPPSLRALIQLPPVTLHPANLSWFAFAVGELLTLPPSSSTAQATAADMLSPTGSSSGVGMSGRPMSLAALSLSLSRALADVELGGAADAAESVAVTGAADNVDEASGCDSSDGSDFDVPALMGLPNQGMPQHALTRPLSLPQAPMLAPALVPAASLPSSHGAGVTPRDPFAVPASPVPAAATAGATVGNGGKRAPRVITPTPAPGACTTALTTATATASGSGATGLARPALSPAASAFVPALAAAPVQATPLPPPPAALVAITPRATAAAAAAAVPKKSLPALARVVWGGYSAVPAALALYKNTSAVNKCANTDKRVRATARATGAAARRADRRRVRRLLSGREFFFKLLLTVGDSYRFTTALSSSLAARVLTLTGPLPADTAVAAATASVSQQSQMHGQQQGQGHGTTSLTPVLLRGYTPISHTAQTPSPVANRGHNATANPGNAAGAGGVAGGQPRTPLLPRSSSHTHHGHLHSHVRGQASPVPSFISGSGAGAGGAGTEGYFGSLSSVPLMVGSSSPLPQPLSAASAPSPVPAPTGRASSRGGAGATAAVVLPVPMLLPSMSSAQPHLAQQQQQQQGLSRSPSLVQPQSPSHTPTLAPGAHTEHPRAKAQSQAQAQAHSHALVSWQSQRGQQHLDESTLYWPPTQSAPALPPPVALVLALLARGHVGFGALSRGFAQLHLIPPPAMTASGGQVAVSNGDDARVTVRTRVLSRPPLPLPPAALLPLRLSELLTGDPSATSSAAGVGNGRVDVAVEATSFTAKMLGFLTDAHRSHSAHDHAHHQPQQQQQQQRQGDVGFLSLAAAAAAAAIASAPTTMSVPWHVLSAADSVAAPTVAVSGSVPAAALARAVALTRAHALATPTDGRSAHGHSMRDLMQHDAAAESAAASSVAALTLASPGGFARSQSLSAQGLVPPALQYSQSVTGGADDSLPYTATSAAASAGSLLMPSSASFAAPSTAAGAHGHFLPHSHAHLPGALPAAALLAFLARALAADSLLPTLPWLGPLLAPAARAAAANATQTGAVAGQTAAALAALALLAALYYAPAAADTVTAARAVAAARARSEARRARLLLPLWRAVQKEQRVRRARERAAAKQSQDAYDHDGQHSQDDRDANDDHDFAHGTNDVYEDNARSHDHSDYEDDDSGDNDYYARAWSSNAATPTKAKPPLPPPMPVPVPLPMPGQLQHQQPLGALRPTVPSRPHSRSHSRTSSGSGTGSPRTPPLNATAVAARRAPPTQPPAMLALSHTSSGNSNSNGSSGGSGVPVPGLVPDLMPSQVPPSLPATTPTAALAVLSPLRVARVPLGAFVSNSITSNNATAGSGVPMHVPMFPSLAAPMPLPVPMPMSPPVSGTQVPSQSHLHIPMLSPSPMTETDEVTTTNSTANNAGVFNLTATPAFHKPSPTRLNHHASAAHGHLPPSGPVTVAGGVGATPRHAHRHSYGGGGGGGASALTPSPFLHLIAPPYATAANTAAGSGGAADFVPASARSLAFASGGATTLTPQLPGTVADAAAAPALPSSLARASSPNAGVVTPNALDTPVWDGPSTPPRALLLSSNSGAVTAVGTPSQLQQGLSPQRVHVLPAAHARIGGTGSAFSPAKRALVLDNKNVANGIRLPDYTRASQMQSQAQQAYIGDGNCEPDSDNCCDGNESAADSDDYIVFDTASATSTAAVAAVPALLTPLTALPALTGLALAPTRASLFDGDYAEYTQQYELTSSGVSRGAVSGLLPEPVFTVIQTRVSTITDSRTSAPASAPTRRTPHEHQDAQCSSARSTPEHTTAACNTVSHTRTRRSTTSATAGATPVATTAEGDADINGYSDAESLSPPLRPRPGSTRPPVPATKAGATRTVSGSGGASASGAWGDMTMLPPLSPRVATAAAAAAAAATAASTTARARPEVESDEGHTETDADADADADAESETETVALPLPSAAPAAVATARAVIAQLSDPYAQGDRARNTTKRTRRARHATASTQDELPCVPASDFFGTSSFVLAALSEVNAFSLRAHIETVFATAGLELTPPPAAAVAAAAALAGLSREATAALTAGARAAEAVNAVLAATSQAADSANHDNDAPARRVFTLSLVQKSSPSAVGYRVRTAVDTAAAPAAADAATITVTSTPVSEMTAPATAEQDSAPSATVAVSFPAASFHAPWPAQVTASTLELPGAMAGLVSGLLSTPAPPLLVPGIDALPFSLASALPALRPAPAAAAAASAVRAAAVAVAARADAEAAATAAALSDATAAAAAAAATAAAAASTGGGSNSAGPRRARTITPSIVAQAVLFPTSARSDALSTGPTAVSAVAAAGSLARGAALAASAAASAATAVAAAAAATGPLSIVYARAPFLSTFTRTLSLPPPHLTPPAAAPVQSSPNPDASAQLLLLQGGWARAPPTAPAPLPLLAPLRLSDAVPVQLLISLPPAALPLLTVTVGESTKRQSRAAVAVPSLSSLLAREDSPLGLLHFALPTLLPTVATALRTVPRPLLPRLSLPGRRGAYAASSPQQQSALRQALLAQRPETGAVVAGAVARATAAAAAAVAAGLSPSVFARAGPQVEDAAAAAARAYAGRFVALLRRVSGLLAAVGSVQPPAAAAAATAFVAASHNASATAAAVAAAAAAAVANDNGSHVVLSSCCPMCEQQNQAVTTANEADTESHRCLLCRLSYLASFSPSPTNNSSGSNSTVAPSAPVSFPFAAHPDCETALLLPLRVFISSASSSLAAAASAAAAASLCGAAADAARAHAAAAVAALWPVHIPGTNGTSSQQAAAAGVAAADLSLPPAVAAAAAVAAMPLAVSALGSPAYVARPRPYSCTSSHMSSSRLSTIAAAGVKVAAAETAGDAVVELVTEIATFHTYHGVLRLLLGQLPAGLATAHSNTAQSQRRALPTGSQQLSQSAPLTSRSRNGALSSAAISTDRAFADPSSAGAYVNASRSGFATNAPVAAAATAAAASASASASVLTQRVRGLFAALVRKPYVGVMGVVDSAILRARALREQGHGLIVAAAADAVDAAGVRATTTLVATGADRVSKTPHAFAMSVGYVPVTAGSVARSSFAVEIIAGAIALYSFMSAQAPFALALPVPLSTAMANALPSTVTQSLGLLKAGSGPINAESRDPIPAYLPATDTSGASASAIGTVVVSVDARAQLFPLLKTLCTARNNDADADAAADAAVDVAGEMDKWLHRASAVVRASMSPYCHMPSQHDAPESKTSSAVANAGTTVARLATALSPTAFPALPTVTVPCADWGPAPLALYSLLATRGAVIPLSTPLDGARVRGAAKALAAVTLGGVSVSALAAAVAAQVCTDYSNNRPHGTSAAYGQSRVGAALAQTLVLGLATSAADAATRALREAPRHVTVNVLHRLLIISDASLAAAVDPPASLAASESEPPVVKDVVGLFGLVIALLSVTEPTSPQPRALLSPADRRSLLGRLCAPLMATNAGPSVEVRDALATRLAAPTADANADASYHVTQSTSLASAVQCYAAPGFVAERAGTVNPFALLGLKRTVQTAPAVLHTVTTAPPTVKLAPTASALARGLAATVRRLFNNSNDGVNVSASTKEAAVNVAAAAVGAAAAILTARIADTVSADNLSACTSGEEETFLWRTLRSTATTANVSSTAAGGDRGSWSVVVADAFSLLMGHA